MGAVRPKPIETVVKTQNNLPSNAASALSDARSSDSSGRSGRDTERSSQNSLLSMLNLNILTTQDRDVLNYIKSQLQRENETLQKGCFAVLNGSTIRKNQEKINQIESALTNPKSVKIDVKVLPFSLGLSHEKKHQIQRSIYLVNQDQVYLGMNKIDLSELHVKVLDFSKSINKIIEKEKNQDISCKDKTHNIEELKNLQKNFDNFLESILIDPSKKQLEENYRQQFEAFKEKFNCIKQNPMTQVQV
jgi:hypothetical protein